MFDRLWRSRPSPSPVGTPGHELGGEALAEREVQRAFWLVLWRGPGAAERQESCAALQAGQTWQNLSQRLVTSGEFRGIYTALIDELDTGRDLRALEAGLLTLGSADAFVDAAFRFVLGREADPSGRAFYIDHVEAGTRRGFVLRTLVESAEFRTRYETLCPQSGYVPRDVQLCELANPAKWSNPDWIALLRSLQVVPLDRQSMHRKAYEFGQLLFGLTKLGLVREDVHVLSVGAGHEPVLYWLANRVGQVTATDMYVGEWQGKGAREGDASVLQDATRYAPFSYRAERLRFLRMDGRYLAFADRTFDVVYSLSSIEHFGGFDGARAAVADMARVLKPGGVLALATEYCLPGPAHHEAFQPEQIQTLLQHDALELVEPIDELVWRRHDVRPVDLRINPHQTPHMVVTDLGARFTSVFAFLRRT
ncbi:MAG: methyltransferase domain-containing protein [Vicinamibacterales bacterium]